MTFSRLLPGWLTWIVVGLGWLAVAPTTLLGASVNLALGRPTLVSSQNRDHEVSLLAVDGRTTGGRWVSGTDGPHWIEVQLDDTYRLDRLKVWTGESNAYKHPLRDFALQTWNGAAWETVREWSGHPNAGVIDEPLANLPVGRRVRLFITAGGIVYPNGDFFAPLYEIELWGEPQPLRPVSYSPALDSTWPLPDRPLTVFWNHDLQLVNAAGVTLRRLADGALQPLASVTVVGSELRVQPATALSRGQAYEVALAPGVVAQLDSPTVQNGLVTWPLTVAPAAPQIVSFPRVLAAGATSLRLAMDRPVLLRDASKVTVTNLHSGLAASPLGVALEGQELVLSFPALLTEVPYAVRIGAGALECATYGDLNSEIRRGALAGEYIVYETTFATGLEGCATASTLGFASGSARLRRFDNQLNPSKQDQTQVFSNYPDGSGQDFLALPPLNFRQGERYTLSFSSTTGTPIYGAWHTTRRRDGQQQELMVFPKQVTQQAQPFTAPASGQNYLLLYPKSGDVTGWPTTAIDEISLRRALPPALRLHSPAPEATFREGEVITIDADAFGISGALKSLKIMDSGDSYREIFSATGGPAIFPWPYDRPGPRTLTATVVDENGLTATTTVPVTILLADGTLPPFLHWDFDNDLQGWTGPGRYNAGADGNFGYVATSDWWQSSPRLFLFAGETYRFEFDGTTDEGAQVAFQLTPVAGRPSTPDPLILWTLSSSWTRRSTTFTVPADGAYHLTLYTPSGNKRATFDDLRLVGRYNSAPTIAWQAPTADLKTVAGANAVFAVNATDGDGTVARVDFQIGPVTLFSDTQAPFEWEWTGLPAGLHQIVAVAVDSSGATNSTPPRTLDVQSNHLSVSTYRGTAGVSESLRGAKFAPSGNLLLAGMGRPTDWHYNPLYLNDATTADQGFVAELSPDGRTVLRVIVVGPTVGDLALDAAGRVYLALGAGGAVVLNADLQSIAWSEQAAFGGKVAHRIDAGPQGTFVVLLSSEPNFNANKVAQPAFFVYSTSGTLVAQLTGIGPFNTDVCLDEARGRVYFLGFKNIQTDGNPVDIPVFGARDYAANLLFRGYDWGATGAVDPVTGQPRHLNYYTNNMADTRGSRIQLGPDGNVYALFEFDGGNTPLRFSPFELNPEAAVNQAYSVVGGDEHHQMSATTTAPKTFLGRYSPEGDILAGQWITNRLSSGSDNTIRVRNGDFALPPDGRVHIVGFAASGLPQTLDFLPGFYSGGAYYLVYSPDLAVREACFRLTRGEHHAVAVADNGRVALAGYSTDRLFTWRAPQATLSGAWEVEQDAYYAVGYLGRYFTFQTGEHPRLFFNTAERRTLRERLGRVPYAAMLARLQALLAEKQAVNAGLEDPYTNGEVAQMAAFLYQMTGQESYAATAKTAVDLILRNTRFPWGQSNVKGLALYSMEARVAYTYDWCVGSAAWDAAFVYRVSRALVDQAKVIVNNGGTEQNTSPASNWQGSRGATAILGLLATDHTFDTALLDSAWNRYREFFDANLGSGPATRGWNPEGLGYFGYPFGDWVGPAGIALARFQPSRDVRTHVGLRRAYWAGFTAFSTAMNLQGYGGLKPDWTDDHPYVAGNGVYGQAFYYADPQLLPGILYWYNRTQGSLATHTATPWDSVQAGTIWSLLYYPENIVEAPPTEIYDWWIGGDDSGGNGLFTFRNRYVGPDDALFQFKARLRVPGGHDAPDGLGIRLISHGTPWIVGGGRNNPGRDWSQATVYPANPNTQSIAVNDNAGTLSGTARWQVDGGGHVAATMATNNVGATNHTRRVVASFDTARTGADGTYLIADTSTSGRFWQLPTYGLNTVVINGATFTITSPNGASLRGTVLHPATAVLSTTTKARGSEYGPGVTTNKTVLVEATAGDFLVVLTVQPAGQAHPIVARQQGTVADAVVTVGAASFAFSGGDVLYQGTPYLAPDATVTFASGPEGSLSGAPTVQSIAVGNNATAPTVTPNAGYVFLGWDKAFGPVVRDLTVTARYAALETTPTAPDFLSGEALAGGQVRLQWADRSLGEEGFVIERASASSGPWATVGQVAANATQWTDTGLPAQTTFYYRVFALGSVAPSAPSEAIAVTTLPPNGPPVLVSVSMTQAGENLPFQSILTWADPEDDGITAVGVNLPSWLTLTTLGPTAAVLSGTPGLADIGPATLQLTLSDGINPAVPIEVALEVAAGPTVAIVSPGRQPLSLPSGVGLIVTGTATDALPVALEWSRGAGAGVVVFEQPYAATTAVRFPGDGDYTLRLTATTAQACRWADLVVSINGSAGATLATIVDFGGDYTTANRALRSGGGWTQSLDLDGDGSADDFAFGIPFTASQPLSPAVGSNYTGLSARFFGGIVGRRVESNTGFFDLNVVHEGTSDYINARFQPSSSNLGNLDWLVYWDKADFLAHGDSRRVFFGAGSVLRVPSGPRFEVFGQARWVVRSGTTFYASETLVTTSTTGRELTGALLANARWAPYDPATEIDFNAAQTFAVSTGDLSDITAVGLLMDQDALTASRLWPRLGAFHIEATLALPQDLAPVVEAGNPIIGAAGAALPLAATVADDHSTPTVAWEVVEGEALAVAFSAPDAATGTATFSVPGIYRLRLRASDASATTFDDVVVTVGSPSFAEWAAQWPALPADQRHAEADWNRDGWPLLLEYALGRDPTRRFGGGLPSPQLQFGKLRVSLDLSQRRPELEYVLEGSNNLADWEVLARARPQQAMQVEAAGTTVEHSGDTVWVTDRVTVGTPGQVARFLRWVVRQP